MSQPKGADLVGRLNFEADRIKAEGRYQAANEVREAATDLEAAHAREIESAKENMNALADRDEKIERLRRALEANLGMLDATPHMFQGERWAEVRSETIQALLGAGGEGVDL